MINALLGGALIGIAASVMLLFNGRVTGISGIVAGVLKPKKEEVGWRVFFLAGLLLGGITLRLIYAEAFVQNSTAGWGDYLVAGLLVGFGTLLGNGCTSGHGVCGISRMSVRSIIATVVFIVFGILSVYVSKLLRGV